MPPFSVNKSSVQFFANKAGSEKTQFLLKRNDEGKLTSISKKHTGGVTSEEWLKTATMAAAEEMPPGIRQYYEQDTELTQGLDIHHNAGDMQTFKERLALRLEKYMTLDITTSKPLEAVHGAYHHQFFCQLPSEVLDHTFPDLTPSGLKTHEWMTTASIDTALDTADEVDNQTKLIIQTSKTQGLYNRIIAKTDIKSEVAVPDTFNDLLVHRPAQRTLVPIGDGVSVSREGLLSLPGNKHFKLSNIKVNGVPLDFANSDSQYIAVAIEIFLKQSGLLERMQKEDVKNVSFNGTEATFTFKDTKKAAETIKFDAAAKGYMAELHQALKDNRVIIDDCDPTAAEFGLDELPDDDNEFTFQPTLTGEELARLANPLSRYGEVEGVSRLHGGGSSDPDFNLPLDQEDLRGVHPGPPIEVDASGHSTYNPNLSANAIAAYMATLQAQAEANPSGPSCYMVNPKEQIDGSGGYAGFSPLMTDDSNVLEGYLNSLGGDIFQHDVVIIPINTGNHWTLAVINIAEQKFEFYDSLPNVTVTGSMTPSGSMTPNGSMGRAWELYIEKNLRTWVKKSLAATDDTTALACDSRTGMKLIDADIDNWTTYTPYFPPAGTETPHPRQIKDNGHEVDCGAIACERARRIINRDPSPINPAEAQVGGSIRANIAHQILSHSSEES